MMAAQAAFASAVTLFGTPRGRPFGLPDVPALNWLLGLPLTAQATAQVTIEAESIIDALPAKVEMPRVRTR